MQKFVHKHAGSVATVALVSLAVILGLVVSVIFGCRAEQARQQEAAAWIQVEQALVRAEKAEKNGQEQREQAEKQRTLAEKQAEEYRRSLYVHRINLADVAYRDGNIRTLRELLDKCPEDLRAWEWYYLDRVSDQAVMTLPRDEKGIFDITLSPDGRRIVSAGGDGTIKIWDTADGKELMTMRGHEKAVVAATFSADGKRIASIGRDSKIKVWNAQSGTELKTLTGDGIFSSKSFPWVPMLCAFSADGKKIASGDPNNAIKVWDVANGTELTTLLGHLGWVTSVAFSPDGKRIASATPDWSIRIWDVATGDELQVLWGHEDEPLSVAFSPDGRRIVSGAKDDTVRIWDAETGTLVHTLPVNGWVWRVCFSPDGKTLATTSQTGYGDSNYTIKLWESTGIASGDD